VGRKTDVNENRNSSDFQPLTIQYFRITMKKTSFKQIIICKKIIIIYLLLFHYSCAWIESDTANYLHYHLFDNVGLMKDYTSKVAQFNIVYKQNQFSEIIVEDCRDVTYNSKTKDIWFKWSCVQGFKYGYIKNPSNNRKIKKISEQQFYTIKKECKACKSVDFAKIDK
jgi:hypothetical protein